MDAIVKFISEKTGLSEELSKSAIEAMMSYLRTKLPKPILELVEKVVY